MFDVVADFGANGDGERLTGAVANTGSATVSVAGATFTQADVGKLAVVITDSAAGTVTTIQAVNSTTQITLATAAGITTTVGILLYGSDNSAAIQAALDAAGLDAQVAATIGPNQPISATGYQTVYVPRGLFLNATALNVPAGVRVDCDGMLGNALASRTAPFITFQPFAAAGRLFAELAWGGGVRMGTSTSTQAHCRAETVELWHLGTGNDGVWLNGYHYDLGKVFVKANGGRGMFHNPGSDTNVDECLIAGADVGVECRASNQVGYTRLQLDTLKGNSSTAKGGVLIGQGCSNIDINVEAFTVTGQTSIASPIVAVGAASTTVNSNIKMEIQANNTGGTLLSLAYCQEATFKVLGSNYVGPSSATNPITTGVAFGTGLAGAVSVDMVLAGSITPYTGTRYGDLTVYQSSVRTFQQLVTFAQTATFSVPPTIPRQLSTQNADFTMTATSGIVLAGAITVTLPTIASAIVGKPYTVKNRGTGVTTVVPQGAGTIDGATSYSVYGYESVDFISDGTNWWVI